MADQHYPKWHPSGINGELYYKQGDTVEIGDLCWWDAANNAVRPASTFTDGGDGATQLAFAALFLGIANSKQRSTDTVALKANLLIDIVVEYPCASNTWTIGDYVEPDYSSGLLDQVLEKTSNNLRGIGRVVARYASAVTKVKVRLWSKLLTGSLAPASVATSGDITVDSITGGDSSLGVTGIAGSSGAGGAVAIAGGAGDSGAGGAVSLVGGAGNGANAGGAASLTGGAGGAGGTGGAVSAVGGAPASGNAAGGAGTFSAGAGSGTGAGGAVTTKGGASGAGATGNGGAWTGGGGAAASTNGTGGAASLTGGVATGTGTGGAVTIAGGASAGASGTAGAVNIDAGAAAGGTGASVNLCASNGTLKVGGATEAAEIKAIKVSGTIAVAVPTIADAEIDEVAVDVSGMTFAPAVGDLVVAIPLEALPTSAILCGAYVSATDTVTVSFAAKEGGSGVTGANKNFKFVFIDLT